MRPSSHGEDNLPTRVTTRVAAAMWVTSAAASIAGVLIARDAAQALAWMLAPVGLAYATVGAVLGARRPANPIGWLFAGWGLAMNCLGFAQAYAGHAMAAPGALPGVEWAGWIMAVAWHPSFALLAFQLLLFPYGHLPSPRWRHFARATVVVYAALALSAAFAPSAPGLYTGGLGPPFTTPIGPVADVLFAFLLSFQLVMLATSMVSLVLRLRRARGRERQQIKGFVTAVAASVTAFIAGVVIFGAGVLFPVFGIIPVAAGVAILRQHLYDIDRIINRTVVYGLLSAVLALVYAVGVLGLGQLFGRASDLAVAGSTLTVAALFQPARRRLQQTVDRRFNRRRYDATRLVAAFSQRCRDQVDLNTIAADLAAVVAHSVEPAQFSLWWYPAAQQPPAGGSGTVPSAPPAAARRVQPAQAARPGRGDGARGHRADARQRPRRSRRHRDRCPPPDQLTDDLAALRWSERLADDPRQAATHAQRRAAEQLRAAGLSVRDVGRLLCVSHQRISQILARESGMSPSQPPHPACLWY